MSIIKEKLDKYGKSDKLGKYLSEILYVMLNLIQHLSISIIIN